MIKQFITAAINFSSLHSRNSGGLMPAFFGLRLKNIF